MPTLDVFTPRAVVVPAYRLPMLREWTGKHAGLAECLAELAPGSVQSCGNPVSEEDPVGFVVQRSLYWWDLMAFLQSRGWRAERIGGLAIENLPAFGICFCGRC